jgi:hypothetical protein
MAQRPRWLSFAALTVIFVITACQPGAVATIKPTGTTPPTGTPVVTGTPVASTPGASVTPGVTPTGAATPAPTGTAYPTALMQPTEPSTITDTFPNYGDPVDCAAGSWNGLPYTGNLKSLTAPDPKTVVFTFCNPDVAFLSKIAFSVFAINDSDWLIAHTADGTQTSTLNGTGAFKFDQWQRGSEIDYSRFD